MPRAGRCRECDAWVWVDENGACQFGHAAEFVDDIHEQSVPEGEQGIPTAEGDGAANAPAVEGEQVAPAPAEPEPAPVHARTGLGREFGEGEMPEHFRRFNWGAFFLPFFWGFAYRSWPVLTAWFLGIMGPLGTFAAFGAVGENVRLSALLSAAIVSEIITGLCRLWAGVNANATVWRREALLREVVPAYKPRLEIGRFTERQRVWAIVGAVLVPGSALMFLPFEAQLWSRYGLTYVGAAMPLVWLGAEIGLGLWLDFRFRKEPPDAERTAHNVV